MTRLPERDPAEPDRSPLQRIAVVLPAWQPDFRLAQLVGELRASGFRHLVLVDDGSSPECRPLFDSLAATPGVSICRHPFNRGKGCALKTGFTHALTHVPGLHGIVTADADGQHTPQDIVRVAHQLVTSPGRVVLGSRTFAAGVPWRSRIGNLTTRIVFSLLSGRLLRDTQTGLRGFPHALLPALVRLPGERYEYEMIALSWLCRHHAPLEELPIQTVYLDSNRGSHFHPLRDSVRVYRALLRFHINLLRRTPPSSIGKQPEKPRLRAA